MKTAPEKFLKTQIYLHWLVVILVAFQFIMSKGIAEIWEKRMDGLVANEPSANPHVIIGATILLLVLWRLFLRFKHGVPALPASENALVGLIAKATHYLFYILLIGMPLSGAGAWVLGIEQPAFTHGLASKLLLALIALHFVAAIYHHFILKTNVFRRMLGMK
jgi:cytochrome b561